MQRVDDKEDEAISEQKKFETKFMSIGFSLIEKALATLKNQDPDAERFWKVATSICDSLQC